MDVYIVARGSVCREGCSLRGWAASSLRRARSASKKTESHTRTEGGTHPKLGRTKCERG